MPKFPTIAIVDVLGKGKGVIAKERILRGTLIVSEKPRIALPMDVDHFGVLATLSQRDLDFLMSFPCGPNERPLRGRVKHFTPCVGDDTFSLGLCPTVCRVNHTCYSPKGRPNAAYFWNADVKEEELRAITEIQAGQEIEVSYIEDIVNCDDPLAVLQRKFGFECSCKGCARPASERETSKQRILAYNDFVRDLPSRFGPVNPIVILRSIERQILIICQEGYTGEVGARAHDAFQLCAYYGDAASARKWEEITRDCHALYQGTKSESFEEAQRLAARPEAFRAWKQLGRKNLHGPSKQVLDYFYPKAATAQTNEGPRSGVASPSNSVSVAAVAPLDQTADPSTSAPVGLSKGQKKRAKEKAKAEANRDSPNVGNESKAPNSGTLDSTTAVVEETSRTVVPEEHSPSAPLSKSQKKRAKAKAKTQAAGGMGQASSE